MIRVGTPGVWLYDSAANADLIDAFCQQGYPSPLLRWLPIIWLLIHWIW